MSVGPVGVPEVVPVVDMLYGPSPGFIPVVVTEPLLTTLTPVNVIPKAPFVLSAPPKVKAPTDHVALIDAALIALLVIFAAELMMSAPTRVPPPTAPVNTTFPVPAASVKSFAPLTVLEKVMDLPVAEVEIEVAPAKVTASAKETAPAAVVLLAKLTVPVPVCVKAALKLRVAPEAKVKRPLLAIARGPLLEVATVLLNVNAVPVRLIPETLAVEMAPLKVEVPAPDNCTNAPTLIAAAVTLFALVIVRELSGWVAPLAPLNVTLPVPAMRFKLLV
jgi:hypothetical protein